MNVNFCFQLMQQDETTRSNELPILPLPLIDDNRIKVLFGFLPKSQDNEILMYHESFNAQDYDDLRWLKMEEILVSEAQKSAPMIFKPTISFYSETTNNTSRPQAIVDEPVHYFMELHNPLQIPLQLLNVKLLWSFVSGDEILSNEVESLTTNQTPVCVREIASLLLQPDTKQHIALSLVPKRVGEVKVLGLSYKLANVNNSPSDQPVVNALINISGKKLFVIKGSKVKNLKDKPGVKAYEVDCRMEMLVLEKAPFMRVSFTIFH